MAESPAHRLDLCVGGKYGLGKKIGPGSFDSKGMKKIFTRPTAPLSLERWGMLLPAIGMEVMVTFNVSTDLDMANFARGHDITTSQAIKLQSS
ncbi:hypothetical protein SCLCIDRAFT_28555 [Scleroderma citrinum Foug A]|uniref:Uncharacterized protein n=1 Tax=Scleroderma citrinum Foug A TaxID=1036808 RepID=A0A0C3DP87_9AGAM|nr:hypothetical protein SCLCIDRAFT_28555 [Scleroderma citrinum Foug A]